MTAHYREVLQSLRCDVNLMRDHCYNVASRSIAARMMAVLDLELSSAPAVAACKTLRRLMGVSKRSVMTSLLNKKLGRNDKGVLTTCA